MFGVVIAWGQNVSFVQTLVWVFDFRSRRVAADGRRTVSDGSEAAFGGCSADRQRRPEKKHLIEAALFGHLDQMLRTTERR